VTRAAFLDRDGTIIRDAGYVDTPDRVELIPGAPEAIRLLNEYGWPVVVVTNQSGIARGYYSMADYEQVRLTIDALLAGYGARIDATFMCPHHPDYSEPCDCRKPGTLLYELAAERMGLDAARSWFVGDRLRDVLPARALGGTGVLVPADGTPAQELMLARRDFAIAPSLDDAVRRAVESAR